MAVKDIDQILSANGPTKALVALRQETGAPQPGVWHTDFNAVRNKAVETGKPMFAVWIQPTCSYCKRFCTAALSQRFRDWMAASGAYFWLGARTDKDGGASGRGFVFTQSDAPDIRPEQRHYYPGCAVWQCERGNIGKVIHDFRASGRTFEQEKSGDEGVSNIIARIEKALQDQPAPAYVEPNARNKAKKEVGGGCPGHADGGCPGGHPHLKLLQEIGKMIAPYMQAPAATAVSQPALRIRMNPALDPQKRDRIIQAIADNGGHCPCQKDKTDATRCLCAAFAGQAKPGVCTCGLYEKYALK